MPLTLAARQAVAFARDIKISHTLFALPFALLAAFLAAGGWFGWGKLGLILACMVTARTLAMASNRLLDARLDALNPRTAGRAIPSGRLSQSFFVAAIAACAALFVATTAGFHFFYANPWPLRLALPVLAFLAAYPLTKRFTRLCHWYLGAALALSPLAASVAVAGALPTEILLLGGAVLMWVAGFDILYACQDYQSDCATGVVSVPAKVGIGPALWLAKLTHLLAAALLIATGFTAPSLGWIYFTGVGAAIALLIIEHALVNEKDLSRMNAAFFLSNAALGVIVALMGIVDVFQ